MPGVSFDRAAGYYDATRGYPPGVDNQIRDALARHLGLASSARLLELGVGTGRIALPFIRAGYEYTGVDIASEMMARLNTKLAGSHAAGLRYRLVVGDVMRVPLANATFDAVVMVHVLHLVDDWRAVLDEARRLLRPGAPLVLGFDEHPDADDPERQSHARWQVYPRWRAILADLGHTSRSTRGSREFGEPSEAYLRERGATVTVDRIFSYPGHAISARQAAARLIGRQQSGEWLLPDDVHDEASRRLQHWLDEECADPDTPVPQTSAFKVIVARFPR